MIQKVLTVVIVLDVTAVILLNFAGCAGAIYTQGFWTGWGTIQEWYSPFNIVTHLLNLLLVSPALIAAWAKDRLSKRAGR
jgi:hypothetical protein